MGQPCGPADRTTPQPRWPPASRGYDRPGCAPSLKRGRRCRACPRRAVSGSRTRSHPPGPGVSLLHLHGYNARADPASAVDREVFWLHSGPDMAGERLRLWCKNASPAGAGSRGACVGTASCPACSTAAAIAAAPSTSTSASCAACSPATTGTHAILDVVLDGQEKAHHAVLKDYQLDSAPLDADARRSPRGAARPADPGTGRDRARRNARGRDAGGVLQGSSTRRHVEALPMEVPDRLEIDVSGLDIGDSVQMADLQVPERRRPCSTIPRRSSRPCSHRVRSSCPRTSRKRARARRKRAKARLRRRAPPSGACRARSRESECAAGIWLPAEVAARVRLFRRGEALRRSTCWSRVSAIPAASTATPGTTSASWSPTSLPAGTAAASARSSRASSRTCDIDGAAGRAARAADVHERVRRARSAAAARFYKVAARARCSSCTTRSISRSDACRCRLGGGLAGHNGLRSIAAAARDAATSSRLRIGVGRPERGDPRPVADFVLSPFARRGRRGRDRRAGDRRRRGGGDRAASRRRSSASTSAADASRHRWSRSTARPPACIVPRRVAESSHSRHVARHSRAPRRARPSRRRAGTPVRGIAERASRMATRDTSSRR